MVVRHGIVVTAAGKLPRNPSCGAVGSSRENLPDNPSLIGRADEPVVQALVAVAEACTRSKPSRCRIVACRSCTCHLVLRDVVTRVRRSRRGRSPAFMPPPAIHMVKQCGWWSRPRNFEPPRASFIGVRPNSPPQTTSVSSSRPRCFRSCDQRGDRPGRSSRHFFGQAVERGRRPCRCRGCPSPSRRAARSARRARPAGARAGSCWRSDASPGFAPYRSRMCSRLLARCPSPRAPRSACGTPARTARCA